MSLTDAASAVLTATPSPNGDHTPPPAAPADTDTELGDFLALVAAGGSEAAWYVWRMDAQQPGAPPRRTRGEPSYVTRYVGAFDLETLKQEHGGGRYKITGFRDGSPFTSARFVTIDGPPRVPSATPAPAAAPATSAIEERISGLERTLERALTALTAQPRDPLGDFSRIVEVIERVRPPAPSADAITGAFTKGIEAAMAAGVGAGKGDAGLDVPGIIRELAPLAQQIVPRLFAPAAPRPRPAAPPPGAAPAPPAPAPNASGSVATVVEPDSPEAEQTARLTTVAHALARAIAGRTDPVLFADTLEVMLLPEEVAQLRVLDPGAVLAQIQHVNPLLQSPEAPTYLGKVMEALRADPDGDGA